MKLLTTIKREFKVAFSLGSQPVSVRIVKWTLTLGLIFLLRNIVPIWIVFSVMAIAGLTIHFYFRMKTKGWTRSFGPWKYEKVFGKK